MWAMWAGLPRVTTRRPLMYPVNELRIRVMGVWVDKKVIVIVEIEGWVG